MSAETEPTVVIVDDDEIVIMLIQRLLRGTGIAYRCAEDGAAAIELIEESEPALFLVDFRLPDCTGIELVAELRDKGRLRNTRIICWSAVDLQPADACVARELGVEVMTKDYLRDRERVLDLLRTSISLPSAVAQ